MRRDSLGPRPPYRYPGTRPRIMSVALGLVRCLPSSLGSLPRDLPTAIRGELCGPRFAALFREFGGGSFFSIGLVIFYLAGRDIDNQLPELDRVAGALEPLRTHEGKYGMPAGHGKPAIKRIARDCYVETDPLPALVSCGPGCDHRQGKACG